MGSIYCGTDIQLVDQLRLAFPGKPGRILDTKRARNWPFGIHPLLVLVRVLHAFAIFS